MTKRCITTCVLALVTVLVRHLYTGAKSADIFQIGSCFLLSGGDNEYKVYSDIEDTRSSNRVEPPNSICTAVRVGGVRIGLKQEASIGRWHE